MRMRPGRAMNRANFLQGCGIALGLFSAFCFVVIGMVILVANDPEFHDWQDQQEAAGLSAPRPYCEELESPLDRFLAPWIHACRYNDDKVGE